VPQIMTVMSALVLVLFIGLTAVWTKAKLTITFLDEFQKIVIAVVTSIIIPILPFFIGCTFCGLAYEDSITKQLPVFLIVILIVMLWPLHLDDRSVRSCGHIFRKESI
jgi:hypothetical protein